MAPEAIVRFSPVAAAPTLIASPPLKVTPFGTVMVKLLPVIDKLSQLLTGLVSAAQFAANASDIPKLRYPIINSKLTHRSSASVSGLLDVACSR